VLASHGDFRARLRGRRNPQGLAGGFAPMHPHQGRLRLPVDPSIVGPALFLFCRVVAGLVFMEGL
jgi:hypothetical protein